MWTLKSVRGSGSSFIGEGRAPHNESYDGQPLRVQNYTLSIGRLAGVGFSRFAALTKGCDLIVLDRIGTITICKKNLIFKIALLRFAAVADPAHNLGHFSYTVFSCDGSLTSESNGIFTGELVMLGYHQNAIERLCVVFRIVNWKRPSAIFKYPVL